MKRADDASIQEEASKVCGNVYLSSVGSGWNPSLDKGKTIHALGRYAGVEAKSLERNFLRCVRISSDIGIADKPVGTELTPVLPRPQAMVVSEHPSSSYSSTS